MSTYKLIQRLASVRKLTWRALDLIVTALLMDSIQYPEEYNWAREMYW